MVIKNPQHKNRVGQDFLVLLYRFYFISFCKEKTVMQISRTALFVWCFRIWRERMAPQALTQIRRAQSTKSSKKRDFMGFFPS
jgi:hypothetical protein